MIHGQDAHAHYTRLQLLLPISFSKVLSFERSKSERALAAIMRLTADPGVHEETQFQSSLVLRQGHEDESRPF